MRMRSTRYRGEITTEYRMVEAARRYYPDTVMIVQVVGAPHWLAFDLDADALHLPCVARRRTAYGYGFAEERQERRYATLDAAELERVIGQATAAGRKIAVLGDVPESILRQHQVPQRSVLVQCELGWPRWSQRAV